MTDPAESPPLLERLVGFPTVSRETNLPLIHFIRDFLSERGVASTMLADETGRKASLFAKVGPQLRGGIMLSGHTDVVPVDGQDWSSDPFRLVQRGNRLFGRGTADMKGFLACALRAAARAAGRPLKAPLSLAFSYDEELGCLGVRPMLDALDRAGERPALCIVGEPTSMMLAVGHKGKTGLRASCCGSEAHSALAPTAVNAIYLAVDLVNRLRKRQAALASDGAADPAYDVPYTTLHVGKIAGGVVLNIVPDRCTVDFEIRNLAAEDPDDLIAAIRADGEAIAAAARNRFSVAAIKFSIINAYPGLDTPRDDASVAFVKGLLGHQDVIKVAFGTEGGLIHRKLGVPTLICGPGSMSQGHKTDEFVAIDQLAACDAMMDRIVDHLAS